MGEVRSLENDPQFLPDGVSIWKAWLASHLSVLSAWLVFCARREVESIALRLYHSSRIEVGHV